MKSSELFGVGYDQLNDESHIVVDNQLDCQFRFPVTDGSLFLCLCDHRNFDASRRQRNRYHARGERDGHLRQTLHRASGHLKTSRIKLPITASFRLDMRSSQRSTGTRSRPLNRQYGHDILG